MSGNATDIERAVARSLRDSLEKLQRNTDEVNHAIGDLVSACSSAKPSNTLPHMLRAQTSAASLAATLDVLSRFITSAMQPGWSAQFAQMTGSPDVEADVAIDSATQAPAHFAAPEAPPALPAFEPDAEIEPEPAAVEETLRTVVFATEAFEQAAVVEPLELIPLLELAEVVPEVEAQVVLEQAASELVEQAAPVVPQAIPVAQQAAPSVQPVAPVVPQAIPVVQQAAPSVQPVAPVVPQAIPEPLVQAMQEVQTPQPVLERPLFDIASLPVDQQELHRRANRVAKVSMQDIKLLRPGDVQTGKENNDLCLRLRDDIERAHKEYERRFHGILNHPVDYFYAWMVEILGEGDARSLGEYPYSSPVARR